MIYVNHGQLTTGVSQTVSFATRRDSCKSNGSLPEFPDRVCASALTHIRDSRISFGVPRPKMACRIRTQRQRQRRKSIREDLEERLCAWRKRKDYSQSETALKLQVSIR